MLRFRYSLPGACPSMPYYSQSSDCALVLAWACWNFRGWQKAMAQTSYARGKNVSPHGESIQLATWRTILYSNHTGPGWLLQLDPMKLFVLRGWDQVVGWPMMGSRDRVELLGKLDLGKRCCRVETGPNDTCLAWQISWSKFALHLT